MSAEAAFIERLRGIAKGVAARGLADDAAVLELDGETLILTHDMMAEGVHWLPGTDARDVAYKLVAVNLSDLAAKGAEPLGVILGFSLGDAQWDAAFADGLDVALGEFGVALLGGDTVSAPGRTLGITALGRATHLPVPSRSGARPGDCLYVSGPIGDGWAGLQLAQAGETVPSRLLEAHHRPRPHLKAGMALAPCVNAMMDISDGLLIDASRMAKASEVGLHIDLDAVPLSPDFTALHGDGEDARRNAVTGGDDYQLLFCAPPETSFSIAVHRIGTVVTGAAIELYWQKRKIALPKTMGFQHE